jgi:parallel beta-helix repeat protein
MKFKKELILFALLVGLMFCFGVNTSNHTTEEIQDDDEYSAETRDDLNLKSPVLSKYWDNFTFIHINGNWSTAAGYEWCCGDGSWSNPYIIENITMNADSSPTGSGILIENSQNDYFVIRNCTVSNARFGNYDAGIKLENTCNGTLINNNCSDNGRLGILLENNCDNNTVSGNIANNFKTTLQFFGILLYQYCDSNIISGNTANNNWWWGIRLEQWCNNNIISGNTASNVETTLQDWGIGLYYYCDNNTISGNIAHNNMDRGIDIQSYCNNNTISDNTAGNVGTINQDYGMKLYLNCDNNIISGNIVKNNTLEGMDLRGNCQHNTISKNTIENNFQYGIYIWDNCDNNTISGNLIRKNQNFGIYIYDTGCENNFIYQNALIGPQGWHAYDSGISNQWNKSGIGNYWDNLTAPDSDNNGIVDIPYSWISGGAGSEDSFPLVENPIHLGEKIHIDDSGIYAWNWSTTARIKVWCSGSGLWNDPYVIDGLRIDGGGSGNDIMIENSNVCFVIRKCIVYNAGSGAYDAGIKLVNANNGIIINNDCSNNGRLGILLTNNCENNTVSGNIASNFGTNKQDYGILLYEYCDNNTISGNTANNNSESGIYLDNV